MRAANTPSTNAAVVSNVPRLNCKLAEEPLTSPEDAPMVCSALKLAYPARQLETGENPAFSRLNTRTPTVTGLTTRAPPKIQMKDNHGVPLRLTRMAMWWIMPGETVLMAVLAHVWSAMTNTFLSKKASA